MEFMLDNLWLHFTGSPKVDTLIYLGWFLMVLIALILTVGIGLFIASIFTKEQTKQDQIISMIGVPLFPIMAIGSTVIYNILIAP